MGDPVAAEDNGEADSNASSAPSRKRWRQSGVTEYQRCLLQRDAEDPIDKGMAHNPYAGRFWGDEADMFAFSDYGDWETLVHALAQHLCAVLVFVETTALFTARCN